MSFSFSIFHTAFTAHTSWSSLSTFLKSDEGGSLRVEDKSTPESPFALIRYVKGKSNMRLPHVRACRSVVWDVMENRPVSITPSKSEDGETLPETEGGSTAGYTVERFLDGVMIGAFWDRYTSRWRIHTRSTLDANTRYYSANKTFRAMFDEFVVATGFKWDTLDKTCSYTWILQHPENRIVTPISQVSATLVQKISLLTYETEAMPHLHFQSLSTWADVRARLGEWNTRFKHAFQGFVVKDASREHRWKIRTPEYNRVRRLRLNTARRDFLWLSAWRSGGLSSYLALFPEERPMANAVVDKWKRATNDIYHLYVDVFKARTLDKTAIPPKYRPLVYAIHNYYYTELKPANKTVNWTAVLQFMNSRDTPQMLFVINWDLRMNAGQQPTIQLEPTDKSDQVEVDRVRFEPVKGLGEESQVDQADTGIDYVD